MFLKTMELLIETEADAIIEMDIGEDLKYALARAIDGIVRELGSPRPDAERVGKVLVKVRWYKTTHTASPNEPETKAKPKPAPRYFGFLTEIGLEEAVEDFIYCRKEGGRKSLFEFWDALKKDKRITRQPHVTIVHSKHLPDKLALREHCSALHALASYPVDVSRPFGICGDG